MIATDFDGKKSWVHPSIIYKEWKCLTVFQWDSVPAAITLNFSPTGWWFAFFSHSQVCNNCELHQVASLFMSLISD